jgi:hypothetical protein
MSLLLRAAVLGGIAYFITRSMRGPQPHQRSLSARGHRSMGSAAPLDELHPGEDHVWPTSESQRPVPANAGPTS